MNAVPAMRPVRIFHRGAVVEVDARDPTRTVLDWLREDRFSTGTKEGCAEGDCGACTVVVGTLQADGSTLALQPVNSCIRFVPTLDGRALFTVEDLQAGGTLQAVAPPRQQQLQLTGGLHRAQTDALHPLQNDETHPLQEDELHPVPNDKLHPVQRAMVECHGSQCGFCTPGFVMSLWACWQRHRSAGTVPTRQQLADDLSGNLCRCTGYRPIIDAGQRMFDAPAAAFDPQTVVAALQSMRGDGPLHTAGGFHAPTTLVSFAALRADKPDARLLAGSTDVGLWVTKQFRDLGELLFIGNVAELQRVTEQSAEPTAAEGETGGGVLRIGAAATLEAAWTALVARRPALRDVWLRFASLPIRSMGTMGGNVANGSPIGDSAPVLMALDAAVVLRLSGSVRSLPLADFYTGYMQNRMARGEFIEALLVPLPTAGERLRVYKISKRFDSDISAVCAALAVHLHADGAVARVRFAFGGMAATVRRAAQAEAAVAGRRWNAATLQAAKAALADDFQPLSDMRASAAYRLQVAQNLLQRFWLETRVDDPLPESAVSVFARNTAAAAA